jgi:putative phage-type endonuclease
MKLTNEKLSSNPHQRNANWYADRLGCLTGSAMAAALDFTKAGKPGAARTNLIKRLLAERMTDQVVSNFVSAPMQWGIDNEEKARLAYQEATGNEVIICGFALHPTIENCGASPDGLIQPDGLVEFKCPSTETHITYMLEGVVPECYKPQMLLQLACTERNWCDFASFDPRILDPKKRIFVRRFEPSKEEIKELEGKAIDFLAEVDELFDRLFV